MKLLYTRKERAEYHKACIELGGIPLDPFTNIQVNKGETVIEEEQAKQDYIIEGYGLNFAMGQAGLVTVAFLKNDVRICPALPNVAGIFGDSTTMLLQECIQIKQGEEIKIKIENADKQFDHIVGVRVDVKELK